MAAARVELLAVPGIGEIAQGDDLAAIIVAASNAAGMPLSPGDIVVASSKIISKTQGLWSPDRVAAVRDSTIRIVAERATFTGVTRIVESVAGPVMAAGGVDASNTGGRDDVLVLPADPDAAAAALHAELAVAAGVAKEAIGVVVTDTAGRPWRGGQTDFALGLSGVSALDDLRGAVDADGRELAVTSRAVADEIASAADLVKGKVGATPVAIVRGLDHLLDASPGARGGRDLVRTGPGDWFAVGHLEAVRAALGVAPGSADSERIGIPALHEQPLSQRVQRALDLARHGEPRPPEATVSPDGRQVTISDENPYATGRFMARLEIALHNEKLGIDSSDPSGVHIVNRG